jgi:hypothetical protein
MGASTFYRVGCGENVQAAFDNARRDAMEESGDNPYSGDLYTKDSYIEINSEPQANIDAAYAEADRLLKEQDGRIMDKNGPAGAIRFRDSGGYDYSWLFFGWAPS